MRTVLLIALASCGTSSLPAGAECHATSECDTGLDCLDLAQFAGSACTVIAKTCSKTCTGDPGCADLGAGYKCFAGCGSAMTCGPTE